MSRLLLITVPVGLLCSAAWALQDGAPLKPGRLPKEEQAALRPGLTLRFSKDAAGPALDARRVRVAALHVPKGGAPTPLLAPGPFVARLTGYVKAPLRSAYAFRVVATGPAVLRVNGKELIRTTAGSPGTDPSEPTDLAKGFNRLELELTAPADADATVRLYWSGENFDFEPIPPEVLSARGDEADLVAGSQVREGRLLYATLGCARCHALPAGVTRAAGGMPELGHEAPALERAGQRFRAGWLAKWTADPRALRPEAPMPRLLHGEDAGQKAADLAAYLGTLKAGAAPAGGGAADAAAGEKTFNTLGCVTCHRLQPPGQPDELNRLSLSFVAAKFQGGALEAFLRQPHRHYPWIRMPDFKLDAKEAGNLAAYLTAQATGTVEPPAQAGSAERGAKLFQEVGCAACHTTQSSAGPAAPRLAAVPRGAGAKGCLAADPGPRGRAPDFGLTAGQRAALAAFLRTDGVSLTRETPAEFSLRQVQALQCQACHRRDGATTRWHQLLEEEGKVPEAIPALTWAGQKLHPAWAARFIAGQADRRARPWLRARMPAFPARADLLALGLSHEHGYPPGEDPRPKFDPHLAAIGAKLIPQQGGFNCIMCHPVGSQKAVEPFEAPGINLLDAALRLRYEYYQRWMRDPSRVDVTTRMPVFAPDGKTTAIRDVLDGDAPRQFEALWHFIQSLPSKDGRR